MIERMILENFKSHRRTELQLGRLTALVGPNGCGKTSVLKALTLAGNAAKLAAKELGPPLYGDMLRRGTDSLGLSFCFDQPTRVAELKLAETQSWEQAWVFESDTGDRHERPDFDEVDEPGKSIDRIKRGLLWRSNESFNAKLTAIKAQLGREILKFSSQHLAEPSYSDEIFPSIGPRGEHLATVLATLKSSQEDRFNEVLRLTRLVVPRVEQIRVRRAPIQRTEKKVITYEGQPVAFDESRHVVGEEVILDIAGVREIPGSEVSEGTLIALGLITALIDKDRPNLILLDDIEQGLHPKAQRELVDVIKKIQDLPGNEDLQVIFTTHSPYVVDEMDPKDVWVMAMDDEGVTVAKRLSDHPEVRADEGILTTGELWSALGEDWVLEGAEDEAGADDETDVDE